MKMQYHNQQIADCDIGRTIFQIRWVHQQVPSPLISVAVRIHETGKPIGGLGTSGGRSRRGGGRLGSDLRLRLLESRSIFLLLLKMNKKKSGNGNERKAIVRQL